jgi:hypothetical protein
LGAFYRNKKEVLKQIHSEENTVLPISRQGCPEPPTVNRKGASREVKFLAPSMFVALAVPTNSTLNKELLQGRTACTETATEDPPTKSCKMVMLRVLLLLVSVTTQFSLTQEKLVAPITGHETESSSVGMVLVPVLEMLKVRVMLLPCRKVCADGTKLTFTCDIVCWSWMESMIVVIASVMVVSAEKTLYEC